MPADVPCAEVRERLEETFLARREPAEADRAHLERCAGCAAEQRELFALAGALDAWTAPELGADAFARARRAAVGELARLAAPARAPVPVGFRRELVRLVGAAVAGLPVVLLWNLAVLRLGGELLTGLVPTALITGLGAAYALAAAGWLALLFGSIPFVAHGRSQKRLLEANP